MRRRTSAILASLAALASFAAPAAHARQDAPCLRVTAEGVVHVPADQVEVSFSVVTNAKTPDEALTVNQTRVDDVRRALKAIGFDAPDVTTAGFSIYPQYDHPQREPREPQITGYQVTNSVHVRTKKLEAGGKIIQAAVNAGANRVEQVSFTLSGAQGRNEAIEAAAAQARADAEALAKAAGVALGPPRFITLGDAARSPGPVARFRMEAMAAGAPEPTLTPGAIPVRAEVTIEYAITQK